MIHFHSSNRGYIKNIPPDVMAVITRNLTIPNPIYYKMARMGNQKALYTLKKEYGYCEYDLDTGIFSFPKGSVNVVRKYLDKIGLEYKYTEDKVMIKRKYPVSNTIVLRDYQEPLVERMLKLSPVVDNVGIIHLSTGGGKTIVALDFIAKMPYTATIIVNNTVLLNQFKEECKKFLGVTPAIIGRGKKEIGEITVATIQSLMADPLLAVELAERTSILIVDECSGFVGDASRAIIDLFKPTFFYGLSATPERSTDDGRSKAIKFIFGPIIASHQIEHMQPVVDVYCTNQAFPVLEYPEMIENVIRDETRNKFIASLAGVERVCGKKVLILTKRVEHYHTIYEQFEDNRGIYEIDSDNKNRNEILYQMKTGELEYSVILGTFSLLGTGFDIPTLDTLIIAGDLKSNILTQQSCGRILRLLNGKEPKIIDICDDKNPILKRQAKSRIDLYKKMGWIINIHPEYMTKWLL